MKKSIFISIIVSLALAACQEIIPVSTPEQLDTLSAMIEQECQTKTCLNDNNILWSADDQIMGYIRSSFGCRYQVKPEYAGKGYASFSKVSAGTNEDLQAGIEWDHVVAYYPYDEGLNCSAGEDCYTLDVLLPAEQDYVAGSFSNCTWPMAAVSTTNQITFKNVCGGMKLQLTGSQIVTSISVQGRNKEKLSGAAVVTAYTDSRKPAVTMGENAGETVTLICQDGVQLNEDEPTEFILTLPPTEFINGFIVTITDDKDETYTIETEQSNSVVRSGLLVMPACEIPSEKEEPIEYTLSQGYASEGTLNNSASHRVKTNMIYGSFSVKVNEGYVIRAVYTYPTAAVTSNYTCVLANCTDRTEIDVLNEGRYAVITFAKASNPSASISPSENIVKSLTRYEIDLPESSDCPYINSAVFFGDSIMHGVYSYYEKTSDGRTLRKNGFDSDSNSYLRIPDYFGLLAGATVTNNGKRGSGWITDTRNLGNALEMANKTDFSKYDFAAFCLGINDWIQGAKIGSLDEPGATGGAISEGTVVANMIACFEKVNRDNPQCKIVVYSPYISWGQCSDGGDYTANTLYGDITTGYALGAVNKAGYTLQDLIDVIDEVCCHYDILHVRLSQSKVCTMENVKDVMIDGLHPSREVRPLLAQEILELAQQAFGFLE